MKTNYILSTLLLSSLALASCKRDNSSEIDNGQPAKLTVKLAGSDVSKAAGAPVVATETAITKGVIFVFKGTGSDPALDGKATFDFTSATLAPVTVNITQGTRQIYVVANANPDDFTMINNLSDLYNMTNKLSLSAFRAMTGLPMSGYVPNFDATTATTTNPATVTIPLNFIGSRVHVDWDITNLNPGLSGLTIDGVALLNVHEKSDYIATPNGSGGYSALTHNVSDYLHGLTSTTGFSGIFLPSAGTNNADAQLWVPQANKGFDNNYTYVFENGSVKPMIVAFKGTYDGQTYYWPVGINSSLNGIGGVNGGDQSTFVKRGTIYKVKAVIKGLGVEDPYSPISYGAIEVTIVPAAWQATVMIDQQFN